MSSPACRICLRTHVPMQDLPDHLKTFHEELCYVEIAQHKRLRYCALCTHQLKKFYKFKGQCLSANGLLMLWIKQNNKDISEYRKELPAPSVQLTNNCTSFLFECHHGEEIHNNNVVKGCNGNLLLKLNRSNADYTKHPNSPELALKSKPIIRDGPNPDTKPVNVVSVRKPAFGPNIGLRPVIRPNIGLRPAIRPNIGLRPVIRPNIGLRPVFRPNFGVGSDLRSRLETEHVKAQNGILTIDPNLITSRPKPVLRPNLIVKPALRPNLILRPNPTLGLSIMLEPAGHKQPTPADLTFDPDFDVSYESDPLNIVKEESEMDVVENTMDIVKNTVHILPNEEIEKQKVGEGEDVASEVEIEQIEVDEHIDRAIHNEEKLHDNDSMDDKEDELINSENELDKEDELVNRENESDKEDELVNSENESDKEDELVNSENKSDKEDELINRENESDKEDELVNRVNKSDKKDELVNRENESDKEDELINRVNESDKGIDSDEYEYEYLEQDVELLDFAKSKRKEPVVTNIQETNAKEPKIIVLKIETAYKNFPRPAQNETNIPPKEIIKTIAPLKCKLITNTYNNISNVKLNPQDSHLSPGFKAVPTFKEKMFGLFDENTFVLDDETVLTKELFSVIYDKINVRELKRLAIIILEDNFLPKLSAYLGLLYRKYNPDYDSIFHVEYLHTEEKKKEEFKRRELHPDYIRAAYKCDLCFKTFTAQKFVNQHKKVYHDPARPLKCSICSYTMASQDRLITHRTLNHLAAYSCKLCTLRTNLASAMRNHYNSHKGVQYECNLCHEVFYHQTTLNNHKRAAHATHVCLTCAQQYTTEKGLLVHRETHHKDVPPPHPSQTVPCVPCGITFDSQQGYQRHCYIAHTSHPEQRESYPRRRRVKAPPTKKEKEKKRMTYRTCEVCNEKVDVGRFSGFLYKHFLEKHPGVPYPARDSKPKEHLCDECGKSFYYQSTLNEHKNSHSGLRPFVCAQCPASFHTKARLGMHRALHSAERKHRCDDCGKLFKNSAHLYTHKMIHIGDRRFKCSICGKGFLLNGALKEHVQGVHYKQRRVKKPKKQTQETSGVIDSKDV